MDYRSTIDRRSALKLLSASAAALAGTAGGCLSAFAQAAPESIVLNDDLIAAAKREGTLYYRYSAQTPTTQAIVNEFTNKYGINITAERRVGAEGTNAFLAEERAGQHIVDVHVQTDRQGMVKLCDDGFYEAYRVENDSDYDPSVKYKDFAYSVYMNTAVVSFNTDRIAAKDAIPLFDRTWQGLLDPRFKNGGIGIQSPFITAGITWWFAALSRSPKYGDQFLRKVVDTNPIIYSDEALATEALYAGEIDVLVGAPLEELWRGLSNGAAVAWTYPDIVPVNPSVFHFISAKAPHPNAARLFMAWQLSREGATAVSVKGGRISTIKAEMPMSPNIQAALSKTSWWKPMPADVRFAPTVEESISQEDGYRAKMVEMFNISMRN